MPSGTTAPSQRTLRTLRTLRIRVTSLMGLAKAGIRPAVEVREDAVPDDAELDEAWFEAQGAEWVVCLRLSSQQWPAGAPDECMPVFHTLPAPQAGT